MKKYILIRRYVITAYSFKRYRHPNDRILGQEKHPFVAL